MTLETYLKFTCHVALLLQHLRSKSPSGHPEKGVAKSFRSPERGAFRQEGRKEKIQEKRMW